MSNKLTRNEALLQVFANVGYVLEHDNNYMIIEHIDGKYVAKHTTLLAHATKEVSEDKIVNKYKRLSSNVRSNYANFNTKKVYYTNMASACSIRNYEIMVDDIKLIENQIMDLCKGKVKPTPLIKI